MVASTMSWAFYVTLINMVMTPRVYAADAHPQPARNKFLLWQILVRQIAMQPPVLRTLWKNTRTRIQARMSVGRSPRNTRGQAESANLNLGKYGAGNLMKVS